MMRAKRHSQLVNLARQLGLPAEGDCATALVDHAVRRAAAYLQEHPAHTLATFQRLVANRLGVKVEWLHGQADLERLADKYKRFCPDIRAHLKAEFVLGETEGITLEGEPDRPGGHRYLAVVNAMGARSPRAYFTSWHEIAHLLVHPGDLPFEAVRRYSPEEQEKDPLEQVVDQIAARLAFYSSFFEPALRQGIRKHGGFGFAAVEHARKAAAPEASLFASALGSLPFCGRPTLFLKVAPGLKKSEARVLKSAQPPLAFFQPSFETQVRATRVIPGHRDHLGLFAIKENMRIPPRSVLTTAFESPADIDLAAEENQGWWETRATGSLAALPLQVHAVRRGGYVYGLVEAAA